MNGRTILISGGLVLCWGVSHVQAQGGAAPSGPVVVKPPAAVMGKATGTASPASATKKTSIGKGSTSVKTANAPDDTDSFWVETVDIDGDGNPETTDLVWDDEDKVLYLYADGDFTCANGGTGNGGLLIAINGEGNSRGRPAGSGWYAVSLDEGECKAKAAGVYGCKFDAKGNPTACGLATLDEKNDDLLVVTTSK